MIIGKKLEIKMAKNELIISKLITLYRFNLIFSVLAVQFFKEFTDLSEFFITLVCITGK